MAREIEMECINEKCSGRFYSPDGDLEDVSTWMSTVSDLGDPIFEECPDCGEQGEVTSQ